MERGVRGGGGVLGYGCAEEPQESGLVTCSDLHVGEAEIRNTQSQPRGTQGPLIQGKIPSTLL